MALEFFCGIGGFHSALKQSNFDYDVLCAFDVSPNSNEVYIIPIYSCFYSYKLNFPSTKFMSSDICGITYLLVII